MKMTEFLPLKISPHTLNHFRKLLVGKTLILVIPILFQFAYHNGLQRYRSTVSGFANNVTVLIL